ncbi:glycoside hydrolase family 104 protein [Comamonas sp. SY3]|uniref:glycoside hydrolase family 24 protein n=1 Tax=Comamonas sp. SY3 TaxID=3243601 RepID=UPI0035930FD5
MSTARCEIAPQTNANRAAFLDALAWAEGTDNGRQATTDRGYDVLVGGGLFTSYATHPNILVPIPRYKISSTAAGRYQLLYRWYAPYAKSLGLIDFSPLAQDKIALQQIREQGALPLIDAGDFELAIAKVRNIWASLPGAGYGQNEQQMANLLAAYSRAGGAIK